MTNLNIEMSAQYTWSGGDLYAFVFCSAADLLGQNPLQQVIQIGSPQNPSATPYPIFPTTDAAIAYYQSTMCGSVLTSINALTASGTYYSGYNAETVPTSTAVLVASVQSQIPTVVSALTNDVPYVSSSSLTSTLSSYATSSFVTSGLATKQNSLTTGSTSQYLRGDLSLATFPTVVSTFTNDAGYINSSALSSYLTSATAASTYATITTVSSKFNTPTGSTSQYVRGDGTLATLPAATARSFNNTPTHTIVTTAAAANGFQLSTTRDAQVSYSVLITVTASIASGQAGSVVLELAATNSSTSSDWTAVATSTSSQTYSLAVAIQGVQASGQALTAIVPAGYYTRLRSINTTGTPTYTYVSGQEVLL